MKKALFILALVVCLAFAACGDTPIDQSNSQSVTDGSQDVSASVDSQPDDTSGNDAEAQADPDGEVIPYGEIQTDMYLTSEKRVNSDGTVTEVKYTYDSEGRLLSAIRSDGGGTRHEYPDYSTEITYYLLEGGEVYQKQIDEYDGKHQLLSSLYYDGNGELMGNGISYSNIYYEPNMISQIRYYTTDLEHFETVDIEYSDGKVISRVYKDENGETVWDASERFEYSKDEDGNTVTKCYRGDGDELKYMNIVDSEGRPVLDVIYVSGTAAHRTEVVRDGDTVVTTTYDFGKISAREEAQGENYVRSEMYDTDGKLDEYTIIERTPTTATYSHYDCDNNFTSKNVHEYALDGRLLSTTVYYADGDSIPYYVYTYDDNNLLVKAEELWNVEAGASVVTYEYTKIEGVFRSMGDTDNRG